VKVLVDTPVWSLAYRRSLRIVNPWTAELAALIDEERAAMIGPVRQEVLSGLREAPQFDRLRQILRVFSDLTIEETDYENAARFYNRCRARGIQGSNTDFLLCAVASRLSMSILTTDRDFNAYANLLPIKLHETRQTQSD
jgi:predicted nucleic acid-binding protein